MQIKKGKRTSGAVVGLLSLLIFNAQASDAERWDTFSDYATLVLTGSAFALPMYHHDGDGAKQAAYSIGTAGGIGYLGKSMVTETRPDNSGNDSLPSNHAAVAFAAATTMHIRYGWEVGLPAYGVASLIGIGRVQADKHYWKDVFAGALIGSLSSMLFTDAGNRQVSIFPWIEHKQVGLSASISW